jgi:hypothetical protein
MFRGCSCHCFCHSGHRNCFRETPLRLSVEELIRLNEQRIRGIIYVDRICERCPSCSTNRCRSLQQIL